MSCHPTAMPIADIWRSRYQFGRQAGPLKDQQKIDQMKMEQKGKNGIPSLPERSPTRPPTEGKMGLEDP